MQLLSRHWFLCGLAAVLVVGLLAAGRLSWLADAARLRNTIVATVLFLTALPLETEAMWRAVRRPWPALLAVALNYGLLPLLAWAASPLLYHELGTGLIIAAAAPCTLASAAVWTRRAGGNDAVALLVTLATNLSCFVVMPLWLLATTGRTDIHIRLDEMILDLAYLVVLPIALAQLLRQHRVVGPWAAKRKVVCGLLAQLGILVIVLMGAIQCGMRLAETDWQDRLGLRDFLLMVILGLGIHLVVLTAGHGLGQAAGMDRAERIAVGFAGSQKTLMIGLYVALTYYGGLTLLPMVSYHVAQLLADTVIADRLAERALERTRSGSREVSDGFSDRAVSVVLCVSVVFWAVTPAVPHNARGFAETPRRHRGARRRLWDARTALPCQPVPPSLHPHVEESASQSPTSTPVRCSAGADLLVDSSPDRMWGSCANDEWKINRGAGP